MRNWLGTKWKSLLGYISTIVRLIKNWYSFHFLSMEDFETIRSIPWVHGKNFLALHNWYIGYNPLHNAPTNKLIWVKLPGLLIELWTKDALTDIGNAIGKFVYVDLKCLGAKDKRVAWILIEKEYRGGFPDHINFHWGTSISIRGWNFGGCLFTVRLAIEQDIYKTSLCFVWAAAYREGKS